tara:strand:- start:256 stop:1050 length:795 start_codon:yes stop_codon:yes gene_type:complete
MKTKYYLTGFPRAGNTLLSSILNQNPKINTTGLSFVNALAYECFKNYSELDTAKNFPDKKSFHNANGSFIDNYYKDWPGDIIIERTHAGLFTELEVIHKYNKNDIKFIVLVRDLFEVVCSFIKLFKEDKNFFMNKKYNDDNLKIEALFSKESIVSLSLDSIYNLYYGWHQNCLFIQYNNLVTDTKNQINKIYDFLNIDSFDHSYTNLNQFKVNNIKYDDSVYGQQLHTIKTDKIEKTDNSEYMKYIPDMYFKKFNFTNNWLNEI